MDIRIQTLHPAFSHTIRNAEMLADRFFRYDPSSAGFGAFNPTALPAGKGSYDEWVQMRPNSPRIMVDDVHAINATMAARSKVDAWDVFTTSTEDLLALAALSPAWGLFTLSDTEWAGQHCRDLIRDLLRDVMGPYRNLAVTTKVLHAIRPRLIPV